MTLEPISQGPLTILVIHGHLAQYGQANEDIVNKPETILHNVNGCIREDADVEALEESPKAVDPEEHQHQEGRQSQLTCCNAGEKGHARSPSLLQD